MRVYNMVSQILHDYAIISVILALGCQNHELKAVQVSYTRLLGVFLHLI